MMIRRIFSGSIVVLLLSLSSFAAACDVSCAFASMKSDCHAKQTEAQNSPSGQMKMDGMPMPEMSGDDSMNQQMASGPPRTMPMHPAVADMGTCERQSCDQAPALTVKASHPAAAKFDAVCALTGFPRMGSLQAAFHDARGELARPGPDVHVPLSVSLRI
jgi:hypothetical protein